jgi:hypothetical protein
MNSTLIVEIGNTPVRLSTSDPALLRILLDRYAAFITASPSSHPFELSVQVADGRPPRAQDIRVTRVHSHWRFERGDFEAECFPHERRGWLRQSGPNPYSIDTALRILHTVLLAPQGGFLLHAASAVRNGRAFIFTGLSGAGKTTISRLAPPDVALLTDEISYIRPRENGYWAFGTPFAGELAKVGENVAAPVQTVFLLAKGTENRRDPVPPADAARALLRNVLFLAEDPELVRLVFQSACDFVARVPVQRLTFRPDPSVWNDTL